jgi:ribosome-binding protein aMBF1 (putative translation factor)
MTKISTLHKRWLKEPAYKESFEAVGPEFELAQKLIHARVKSGLSQGELAEKMGTSQSSIARMESGTIWPSMRTLARFAKATSCELNIELRPIRTGKHATAA